MIQNATMHGAEEGDGKSGDETGQKRKPGSGYRGEEDLVGRQLLNRQLLNDPVIQESDCRSRQ